MVRRVRQADRGPGQLPGHRLRRRHQGHPGPDRRLRRLRRADDRRAAQAPPRAARCCHIPTALGAVVADLQHARASSTKLKFTGDDPGRASSSATITKWNDPKLVADNPDLANVNQDIVVVHRSDGSGTTYVFTDYLSTVSPDWASKVGKGTSVNWPVGLGGSGNEGVAGEVQQNPYSIGYVELIYALQNKLGFGQVKNKAGKWIEPSLEGVTAAAAGSAGNIPADLRFSIVNAPGDASYPISTATWLLAYKNMTDQPKAVALTRLLWWATHEGQKFNKDLGYATVPDALTAKSEEFIKQITVERQARVPWQVSSSSSTSRGRSTSRAAGTDRA